VISSTSRPRSPAKATRGIRCRDQREPSRVVLQTSPQTRRRVELRSRSLSQTHRC
jgi:hypothetical protein